MRIVRPIVPAASPASAPAAPDPSRGTSSGNVSTNRSPGVFPGATLPSLHQRTSDAVDSLAGRCLVGFEFPRRLRRSRRPRHHAEFVWRCRPLRLGGRCSRSLRSPLRRRLHPRARWPPHLYRSRYLEAFDGAGCRRGRGGPSSRRPDFADGVRRHAGALDGDGPCTRERSELRRRIVRYEVCEDDPADESCAHITHEGANTFSFPTL